MNFASQNQGMNFIRRKQYAILGALLSIQFNYHQLQNVKESDLQSD